MKSLNLKEFRIEERLTVSEWYETNGNLLDNLVEDEPLHYSFNEVFHSIPRGASKRPGPKKEDLNDYDLRSDEYETAGYIKYVCDVCGAEYDFAPETCFAKDDEGYPCYSPNITKVHGSFEGVYIDNKAAIQCGDFQGLARNSVFEDGCNFNDTVLSIGGQPDKFGYPMGGIAVGFCSEKDVLKLELIEQRWATFDNDKLEVALAKRADALATVLRVQKYFEKKAAALSNYKDLLALQKWAGKVLHYAICYYNGHQHKIFESGYVYAKVKITNSKNDSIKANALMFKEYSHNLYLSWAKANKVKTRTNTEVNQYEQSFNKLVKKLKEMPTSLQDKANLIDNGWFQFSKNDYTNAMKHSGYLFRKNGKAPIPYIVFKSLQRYGNKIGA